MTLISRNLVGIQVDATISFYLIADVQGGNVQQVPALGAGHLWGLRQDQDHHSEESRQVDNLVLHNKFVIIQLTSLKI